MKNKSTIQNSDESTSQKSETSPLLESKSRILLLQFMIYFFVFILCSEDTRRIATAWRTHRAKPKNNPEEIVEIKESDKTKEVDQVSFPQGLK